MAIGQWEFNLVMFTGIINHLGRVERLKFVKAGACLDLETEMNTNDLNLGDSVAVNGACLTVTQIFTSKISKLSFDLSAETLEKTNLATLNIGQNVHLEKALCLNDRLGGHLVQGHVDNVGILISKVNEGISTRMSFSCSNEILRYCISKGSITVDGVSLTINKILANSFEICLIPHTLEKTELNNYPIGHKVNLENDLIAKYAEKLLQPHIKY
ncbi:MAG: riboflavin synthase [bacterium]|nr:riboflavin synthase [bacterium]